MTINALCDTASYDQLYEHPLASMQNTGHLGAINLASLVNSSGIHTSPPRDAMHASANAHAIRVSFIVLSCHDGIGLHRPSYNDGTGMTHAALVSAPRFLTEG